MSKKTTKRTEGESKPESLTPPVPAIAPPPVPPPLPLMRVPLSAQTIAAPMPPPATPNPDPTGDIVPRHPSERDTVELRVDWDADTDISLVAPETGDEDSIDGDDGEDETLEDSIDEG